MIRDKFWNEIPLSIQKKIEDDLGSKPKNAKCHWCKEKFVLFVGPYKNSELYDHEEFFSPTFYCDNCQRIRFNFKIKWGPGVFDHYPYLTTTTEKFGWPDNMYQQAKEEHDVEPEDLVIACECADGMRSPMAAIDADGVYCPRCGKRYPDVKEEKTS